MRRRFSSSCLAAGGSVIGASGGFWNNLKKKGEDVAFAKLARRPYGYFYALACDVRDHRAEGPVAVRNAMEETRHRISVNLSRSLKTISTCAALAPMLGLLGTVSGMAHTFDTIKLFGFGNQFTRQIVGEIQIKSSGVFLIIGTIENRWHVKQTGIIHNR